MKKIFAAMAALLVCAGVQAAEIAYQGRVDINGFKEGIEMDKGATSEGGSEIYMTWVKEKEKQNQGIVVMFPATGDWKAGTFSVTPKKDGKLNISFKGAWAQDENKQTIPAWVVIDEIGIEGATLVNPAFEEDGKGWWLGGNDKIGKASIVAGKSGKGVKVCHDASIAQDIQVQAGKPVKVMFWFKKSE